MERLLGDLERGGLLAQSSAPLVNRSARSLADGGDDLVLTGVKGLLLGGGGLGKDGAARSKGLGIRGHDDNDELASGNLVGHSVGQVDGKLGSLGSRLGRDGELGNVGGGGGRVRAQLDLLADVDRIGVGLLQKLGELLNSGNLAHNVANGGQGLGRQQTADLGASASDSDLGDDLNELVESLAHKLGAGRALKLGQRSDLGARKDELLGRRGGEQSKQSDQSNH